MKRNLSQVGGGDEGKSLLTATGKIVHKIKKIEDYSVVSAITFCGRREYPRQRNDLSGPYGTWWSSAHGWHTPVTCQGCIDGEKIAQVEVSGHVVRISRRDLGVRWGATRSSYGRNVQCSCTWKIFTNEYQEGTAKLDRWAEDRKREHLLSVWQKYSDERDEALREQIREDAQVDAEEQSLDEALQELADGGGRYAQVAQETIDRHEEQPRFSDGTVAPIDLIAPTEVYDEREAVRRADAEFYRHQQEQDGCDHLTVVPFELIRVASGHQMKVQTQSGVELWLRLPTPEEFKASMLESGAKLVADGLPADCLPPVPPDEEIERIVRPLNL
jgi:hypothetical protein